LKSEYPVGLLGLTSSLAVVSISAFDFLCFMKRIYMEEGFAAEALNAQHSTQDL
jgi:hypothetical protein